MLTRHPDGLCVCRCIIFSLCCVCVCVRGVGRWLGAHPRAQTFVTAIPSFRRVAAGALVRGRHAGPANLRQRRMHVCDQGCGKRQLGR